MSKRTLFLIFALFIITSVLLIMALYNPNPKPPAPPPPIAEKQINQTVLSFGQPLAATPSSLLSQPAVFSYSVPIEISTGDNRVTAVQLELQYDPEVLTDVAVAPGTFFAKPEILLKQIDQKTGRITYAFGVGLTDNPIAGTGTVAILSFSAKNINAQETTITFLPKSLVTAEDNVGSVLKEAIPLRLTVGKPDSTPPPPPIQ